MAWEQPKTKNGWAATHPYLDHVGEITYESPVPKVAQRELSRGDFSLVPTPIFSWHSESRDGLASNKNKK